MNVLTICEKKAFHNFELFKDYLYRGLMEYFPNPSIAKDVDNSLEPYAKLIDLWLNI